MPNPKLLSGAPSAILLSTVALVLGAGIHAQSKSTTRPGYYRFPAIHGDTVVFTAEGDLWSVSANGGAARRLTSNPGMEAHAAISPDGATVAFSAEYEGPQDVYTIPIEGGLPQRRTWDGDATVASWTPDGKILYRTRRYSTLPDDKLVTIDPANRYAFVPLAQAAFGNYSADGKSLFFTRFVKQGSSTKRYKGGTAENIWRYDSGSEAVPLTADYTGTSSNPMFWNGRVYFLSDRDGVMNLFSMDPNGRDVKQETHQKFFDVQSASLSEGRIVYQSGADLWLLNLSDGKDAVIPITLVSDFDQLRDHWVKKPLEYLTGAHVSPDGSTAVFTARGEIFTMPATGGGRVVKVSGDSNVRYREARYLPDGKNIVALSTQTGETEFWKFPANGLEAPEQLTKNAKVLRWEGIPSPDGRWLAHRNKDQELWLLDLASKQDKRVAQSMNGNFDDLAWSPDSQWLAYTQSADNQFDQIKILHVADGAIQAITSDRYNSGNPAWSTDGKWLYFLSDRALLTTVRGPWGPRQPDPHFDRSIKIYELALVGGLRSPFAPPDELHPDESVKDDKKSEEKKTKEKESDDKKAGADKRAKTDEKKADDAKSDEQKKPKIAVNIDFKDLQYRLSEVPVPPGNYNALDATEKRLCYLSRNTDAQPKVSLVCVDIANKGEAPETVVADIRGYDISLDRKKFFVRKGDGFFILDIKTKEADATTLGKAKIDMSRWSIMTNPRAEFHELFLDAWRLERDYFYDRQMHGIDWVGMRDRYLPLVDRVADRDELNDLIAQMVAELSTLHTFVRGGDTRESADQIELASLGAVLRRDEKAGGFLVQHIYQFDPDLPNHAPPFARPDSRVLEGEVILSIDGQDALSVPDERALIRGKAGHKVLLRVKAADGKVRDLLVAPLSDREDRDDRYNEWEYSRRQRVDEASKGTIGYVHLRAMGPADIEQWAREYYPVFDRQGLIIDVRHNRGGNIDSWLLGKLLRKDWFYWQPRVGNPYWNMQYAFRGHIAVLCDEWTASDGEAFSEGFRRLGLGKVIGVRTWGGEVWLSASNFLADEGIATAAEMGVYGPEGKWLIEGHGVDPDIVVDNPLHATFEGGDAQLDVALKLLADEIKKEPRPVVPHPPYPDKSFKYSN